MKEFYVKPETEITNFSVKDVITTSEEGDNFTPFDPKANDIFVD